jgi:hypothetical protein
MFPHLDQFVHVGEVSVADFVLWTTRLDRRVNVYPEMLIAYGRFERYRKVARLNKIYSINKFMTKLVLTFDSESLTKKSPSAP